MIHQRTYLPTYLPAYIWCAIVITYSLQLEPNQICKCVGGEPFNYISTVSMCDIWPF